MTKKRLVSVCQISILKETRYQAISIDKNFWAITTLSPRKLYISCLNYTYPLSLKHPFDIIYLPNFCEASSDSFLLPSNDKLTQEVDSRNLSIKFINFERKYRT